jgi:DNA-binding MarR family transcriptional regulator
MLHIAFNRALCKNRQPLHISQIARSMGIKMGRFHELNAFIAVVEAGGFSAAARRTGGSQSAISKAVDALEKRLSVVLFHRSTRSVTLTDQGQKYYERTKPLVDEIEVADSELTRSAVQLNSSRRRFRHAWTNRRSRCAWWTADMTRKRRLRVDLKLQWRNNGDALHFSLQRDSVQRSEGHDSRFCESHFNHEISRSLRQPGDWSRHAA